jgi:hypothetical protein
MEKYPGSKSRQGKRSTTKYMDKIIEEGNEDGEEEEGKTVAEDNDLKHEFNEFSENIEAKINR